MNAKLTDALSRIDKQITRQNDLLPLLIQKGLLLRQHHLLTESCNFFNALDTLFPENAQIQFHLAISARRSGDPQRSLTLCQDVLRHSPSHKGAWMEWVEATAAVDGIEAALSAADTALAALPGNIPLLRRKATLLREGGRATESVSVLKELRELAPEDTVVLNQLAISARAAGDLGLSLTVSADVLAADPTNRAAWLARAEATATLQGDEAALAILEEALAALPDDLPLSLQKAVLLRRLLRLDESISFLSALHQAEPEDERVCFQLAQSLRRVEEFEKSCELIDQILIAFPEHKAARRERIELHAATGDDSRLSRDFEEEYQRLLNDPAPDSRAVAAQCICQIAMSLPRANAKDLLRQCTGLFSGLHDAIGASLLWEIYVLADALGLGEAYADFAQAFFAREPIDFPAARLSLRTMYETDVPNWDHIAAHLLSRVPAGDKARMRMEILSYADDAGEALRNRDKSGRGVGTYRSDHEITVIVQLLRRQGRLATAVRYLRWAYRARPLSSTIFRHYFMMLRLSGSYQPAVQILRAARQGPQSRLPEWQTVMSVSSIELGEIKDARAIADGISNVRKRVALNLQNIRYSIGEGEDEDPLARLEMFRNFGSLASFAHFGVSLTGAFLTETTLDQSEDRPNAFVSLSPAAVHRVRDWMADGGQQKTTTNPAKIPRQVFQYWDTDPPPAPLRFVMQSWERQAGAGYRLFNRGSARQFLRDKLGPDWEQAFLFADSSTEESDFFRLCFLMLEGGVYADCDDWLACDLDDLIGLGAGLIATHQAIGVIGNNLIAAAPHHPAVIWAAVAAKQAILNRHHDGTWAKTGPGLLTRAIAHYLDENARSGTLPDLKLIEDWSTGRYVHFHIPLPYKRSQAYWNATAHPGSLAAIGKIFAGA